jgi:hypothetical protein
MKSHPKRPRDPNQLAKSIMVLSLSSVAGQLAASPMMVFARRIEYPLDVTVQGSHDTDAREHRGAAVAFGDED